MLFDKPDKHSPTITSSSSSIHKARGWSIFSPWGIIYLRNFPYWSNIWILYPWKSVTKTWPIEFVATVDNSEVRFFPPYEYRNTPSRLTATTTFLFKSVTMTSPLTFSVMYQASWYKGWHCESYWISWSPIPLMFYRTTLDWSSLRRQSKIYPDEISVILNGFQSFVSNKINKVLSSETLFTLYLSYR